MVDNSDFFKTYIQERLINNGDFFQLMIIQRKKDGNENKTLKKYFIYSIQEYEQIIEQIKETCSKTQEILYLFSTRV